jgi:gas vesicle protein
MEDTKGLSNFFLGLGIGIAIGIIFAPKSGEETRGLIKGKVGEGTEYLKQRGQQLAETASDVVERGKGVVARQRDQLSAAVEAGKQAYREAVGGQPAQGEGSPNPNLS